MPVRGLHTPGLDELYRDEVAWLGDDLAWFDVHTHIGQNDPDGQRGTPHELLEALDAVQQERALVFAMHEPDGYGAANDAVLAACRASEGRLLPLARVDPNLDGALDELRRSLGNGALGLKLHPRSDDFTLDHPVVETLVAEVAERRGMVLFHAGRGIPHLGSDAVALAERHPDARIVLAHMGISDLHALAEPAGRLPNLLFDTAWWHPTDCLVLLSTVPPGQILYASDMPYGPPHTTSILLARGTRALGLPADVVREMAGPQGMRALIGDDLLDLGPAPGPGALGARDLVVERAVSWLTIATQLMFYGDGREQLGLARAACAAGGPALDAAQAWAAQAHESLQDGRRDEATVAMVTAALLAAAPLP